jgi:hypothetical protein
MRSILRWFAFVASLGAVALLLVLPFYSGVTESQSVGGPVVRSRHSTTLVGANGVAALLVLAIPVFAAANTLVPWPTGVRRSLDVLSALVTTAFAVLGAFTVGLFFLPTAAALWAVALWPRQSPAAT